MTSFTRVFLTISHKKKNHRSSSTTLILHSNHPPEVTRISRRGINTKTVSANTSAVIHLKWRYVFFTAFAFYGSMSDICRFAN